MSGTLASYGVSGRPWVAGALRRFPSSVCILEIIASEPCLELTLTYSSLGSRVLENGNPTDNDDGGRLRKGISLALSAGLAWERGGATLMGGPALSAVLAPAASVLVLAYAGPITVHAVAASAPMLADAGCSTVHALVAYPPMLANAGPSTVVNHAIFFLTPDSRTPVSLEPI